MFPAFSASPLLPPASEPEESDDDLEADASSVYSEYENEHDVPDEDMSTVAPSDASVLIYTISERVARYRATEAARRRWSDTISAANEEARVRARDTEDRWSTNSDAGGRRGYIRYDYPMRTPTTESEHWATTAGLIERLSVDRALPAILNPFFIMPTPS